MTLAVFHADRSLLNDDALENMPNINSTWEVFHADRSLLNDDAPRNIELMSVTSLVSAVSSLLQ
eukprot:CAMPEP_0181310666 /NCGR_PEP_ID=MMETSP1101-20121128/12710_2 /TAXON_ID=46948 /ORGANISM="Rhodomonas abbreviata, Strain Caron Lab Isolate" /LENGTH=63 /DNA_ID=CAMNT_0023417315 /DNA_START=264 /DNA_END=452 /DNA_ORIENTATION=-